MAVQPIPPIQLDPSMDKGHELAFINQNFQSIANVLGKNTFTIVASDVVSITRNASATSASLTVSHNLGYLPAILAFLGSGAAGNLPFINLLFTGADAGKVMTAIYISSVSTTDFTIQVASPNYASNTDYSQTITYTIKYYLSQPSAS